MTEHDGKVICAECLAKLLAASPETANATSRLVLLLAFASLGCLLAWVVFYSIGAYLSGLPSEMHGL